MIKYENLVEDVKISFSKRFTFRKESNMRRTRVFIAGRIDSASVVDMLNNLSRMIAVSKQLIAMGYSVYCPAINAFIGAFGYGAKIEYNGYFESSLSYLLVSDVILIISGLDTSSGVMKEIVIAEDNKIKVVYMVSDLPPAEMDGK
jgi:hypothetical protein